MPPPVVPILILLGGFMLSLGLAVLLVPPVRRIALQKGWTDAPDGKRKIHGTPIPNVGGLAIAGAFFGGVGAMLLARPFLPPAWTALLTPPPPLILLGAVVITLVGFWDDLHDLHFRPKAWAQALVAGLVVLSGFRIELLDGVLGGGPLAAVASVGLTVIWMVGAMNAINMIDGMDGLAAGVTAIALAGLAGVHAAGGDFGALVLVAALAGALVGFLRFNFAPASIFMGDSGSLFLGYLLGAYALRGSAHAHPVLLLVIPVVVMGLPVLDAVLSIARRYVQRRSPFYPDRDHIHHRVALRLNSPRRAALALYGVGVFFALGALAMALSRPQTAALIFMGGCVVVGGFLQTLGYFGGAPAAALPRRAREGLRLRGLALKATSSGDGAQGDPAELLAPPEVAPAGGATPPPSLTPVPAPER